MSAPGSLFSDVRQSHKVAALYVQSGGIYYSLPDVDPWDEERDARLYDGPYPVVAHPPCKSWSLMGQCRPEIIRGDDGGCAWSCEIDQANYGHPANKRTWIYYVGPEPVPMQWGRAPQTGRTVRNDGGGGRDQRSITPRAFALELLRLARLCHKVEAAA